MKAVSVANSFPGCQTRSVLKPLLAAVLLANSQWLLADPIACDDMSIQVDALSATDTEQTTTLHEALLKVDDCLDAKIEIEISDSLAGQTIELNKASAYWIGNGNEVSLSAPANSNIVIKDSVANIRLFDVRDTEYGSNDNTLTLNNLTFSGQGQTPRSKPLILTEGSSNLIINNSSFEKFNGYDIQGLAVYFYGKQLTINDSVFSENNAVDEGGSSGVVYIGSEGSSPKVDIKGSLFHKNTSTNGGAIYSNASNATLNISQSSFTENNAETRGGAVYFGGNNSHIDFSNCSFIENTAGNFGAVLNLVSGTGSSVKLRHSTLVGNDVSSAATDARSIASNIDTEISHTIVADGDNVFNVNESGSTSFAYNFITDKQTANLSFVDNGGNIIASPGNVLDPMLAELADNGGATQTLLPKFGSPVINAGQAGIENSPEKDQRGVQRIARGKIDIGAVEFIGTAPTTGAVIEKQIIRAGAELNINADIFSDAEGDSYTFVLSGAPAGIIINKTSGVITGSTTQTGEFNPVITVTDQ